MTLRHLKIFLAVYETGSTTAAAEELLIAQPSVSVALKELEEHYGVRVFERMSKRLYVTQAGQELYQYARHLVSLFEETEDAMKSLGASGMLHVGSSVTIGNYFLPGYIRTFQKEFPQVRVRVTVENTDTIEKLLLENGIDVGLVEGRIHSPYLVQFPYRQDRLVMICPPEHPYASYQSIVPEVLAAEDMLVREKGSAVRERFDIWMAEAGVEIEPVWESVSTRALVRAVRENMGISVLPYYLVEEDIRRGEVKAVAVERVDFTREFSIVYHRNKYHSEAFDAFVRICSGGVETEREKD